MSIIILFNYIPDRINFEEAVTLFYEEFGDHINDPVKSNYMDEEESKEAWLGCC